MDTPRENCWLDWARRIQAIAQTGRNHAGTRYDYQNYTGLLEIAAEIIAAHAEVPKEKLVENFCIQPGYATAKIDVRAAVVEEGRILLVREKFDGRWAMPGGWADVGDYPSEMVAREVQEEAGVIVRPVRVVGVFDANRAGRPSEFFHAYKIVFLCDRVSGEPAPGDETLDARFFGWDELPELSEHRTNTRHLDEIRAQLLDECRPVYFD